jgi:hypothetical protein
MNAFLNGLNDGKMYLNLHTSQFSGGEIRGFYQLVPEPSAISLIGLGSLALVRVRRRRGA